LISAHEQQEESRESIRRRAGGKSYGRQPHFRCATQISSEGSVTLHAPKSRHTSPRLSDATQRVVMRVPNGVHGQTRVYR